MISRLLVIFILFSFSRTMVQEEKPRTMTCLAGSVIVVPSGHDYKFISLAISEGDGYSMLIDGSNFKKLYHSGDTLSFPYYLPEMELLGSEKTITYSFKYLDINSPDK